MKALIASLFFVLAVGISQSQVSAKAEHEIAILAFDALTEMNKPVELWCKIECRNFLRSDVRRANVDVYVNGIFVSKVITDHEGVASLTYTPQKLGTYTVVFECEAGDGHPKTTASTLLFCREKTKPAILVDIDLTISNISLEKFLITKTKDIKPLPGSPEVLEDLAKTHDLIFLTARDEHLLHRTRDWMDRNHFPTAPVFFRKLGKDPFSERKFKTEKIAQMKATWSNIEYGIGNQLSDAQAYVANGLEAYILACKDALPNHANAVESWKQIKDRLKDLQITKASSKQIH